MKFAGKLLITALAAQTRAADLRFRLRLLRRLFT